MNFQNKIENNNKTKPQNQPPQQQNRHPSEFFEDCENTF